MTKRPAATLRTLTLVLLATSLLATTGCVFAAAVGAMAESKRRTGTTNILADYPGIAGHSYAVVTHVNRAIEASEPGISARITTVVNDRLAQNANASDYIPSRDLLAVLLNRPQWPAMPPSDVANMLGVERLVWVELNEYRLNEPGNQYVWDGVAIGNVFVYEADSGLPDDPAYDASIGVTFPDMSGFMRTELPESAMTSELSKRFINRAAWLFYDHEEPNIIPY